MDLTFRSVDADNHYYEALDSCTRYLDPGVQATGVQIVQQGSHQLLLAAGKFFRFIPNPTFDPIIVAGCMDLMFRGQIPEGVDPRTLMAVEPLRPEYQDRDARLAVMDEQDLEAVLMFPTLGCGIEQALRLDVPATMATLHAFNRWLDEDWGYSYQDRIVTAPMISLADPDAALEELDDVIARGARIVHVRPAPVPVGNGSGRSLGDDARTTRSGRARRRGVDPRRVPPGRQRVRGLRRRVGGQGLLRALPGRRRRDVEARGVGPPDPRHHRQPDRARRVPPPPRPPGRAASRTAPTGCTSWPSGSRSRRTRRRGSSRRIRSRPSAATCG